MLELLFDVKHRIGLQINAHFPHLPVAVIGHRHVVVAGSLYHVVVAGSLHHVVVVGSLPAQVVGHPHTKISDHSCTAHVAVHLFHIQ